VDFAHACVCVYVCVFKGERVQKVYCTQKAM